MCAIVFKLSDCNCQNVNYFQTEHKFEVQTIIILLHLFIFLTDNSHVSTQSLTCIRLPYTELSLQNPNQSFSLSMLWPKVHKFLHPTSLCTLHWVSLLVPAAYIIKFFSILSLSQVLLFRLSPLCLSSSIIFLFFPTFFSFFSATGSYFFSHNSFLSFSLLPAVLYPIH